MRTRNEAVAVRACYAYATGVAGRAYSYATGVGYAYATGVGYAMKV